MELDKLRYPPTGDMELWVRFGPAGPEAQVDNWRGRTLQNHDHVADVHGADCKVCGFPWWPDSQVMA